MENRHIFMDGNIIIKDSTPVRSGQESNIQEPSLVSSFGEEGIKGSLKATIFSDTMGNAGDTGIPETLEYKGKIIHLCTPVTLKEKVHWRGQTEVYRKLLAAWISHSPQDLPMNPLLLGPSGIGKTTLAMAVAQSFSRPVFMMNCQGDMEPNDLTVNLSIDSEKNIQYVASPLFTAVYTGGIIILDEFTRLPPHAYASIAPLLDHRRYLEASILPGLRIPAHPEFRIVFTSNYDSYSGIPDYIESRLKPRIILENPPMAELKSIIDANLPSPYYSREFKEKLVEYLEIAKKSSKYREFSPRDAILIGRLAHRLNKIGPGDDEGNFIAALNMTISYV